MIFPKYCQRCFKKTNCLIMSMYNTDMICSDCKEKEKERSDYEDAVKADENAIKSGNYNFKGIGYK